MTLSKTIFYQGVFQKIIVDVGSFYSVFIRGFSHTKMYGKNPHYVAKFL